MSPLKSVSQNTNILAPSLPANLTEHDTNKTLLEFDPENLPELSLKLTSNLITGIGIGNVYWMIKNSLLSNSNHWMGLCPIDPSLLNPLLAPSPPSDYYCLTETDPQSKYVALALLTAGVFLRYIDHRTSPSKDKKVETDVEYIDIPKRLSQVLRLNGDLYMLWPFIIDLPYNIFKSIIGSKTCYTEALVNFWTGIKLHGAAVGASIAPPLFDRVTQLFMSSPKKIDLTAKEAATKLAAQIITDKAKKNIEAKLPTTKVIPPKPLASSEKKDNKTSQTPTAAKKDDKTAAPNGGKSAQSVSAEKKDNKSAQPPAIALKGVQATAPTTAEKQIAQPSKLLSKTKIAG